MWSAIQKMCLCGVSVLWLLNSCSTNHSYAGKWNYKATLDDGTILEGETEATQSIQNNQTIVQLSDYSGVLKKDQIHIEVREQRDNVLYEVTGTLAPEDSRTKLSGQLKIKETHSSGEVVNTLVTLQAWR